MMLSKLSNRVVLFALLAACATPAIGCATEKDESSSSDDADEARTSKKKKSKKKPEEPAASASSVAPVKVVEIPTAPPLELPNVDETAKQRARLLETQVTRARFPYDETSNPANANAFVHLAATATDRQVVIASLRAMRTAFKTWEEPRPDENYARAVLLKIHDPDGVIQAAALGAASNIAGLETPHIKTMTALVELAATHPRPEGRFAAIDAIDSTRDLGKQPLWLAPVLAALDAPESYLVSKALETIQYKTYGMSDKASLQKKLVALLEHANPGVRGLAANALASLAGFDDAKRAEMTEYLLPLLDDTQAYTRAAACSALASLRAEKAIHKIITLVDDQADSSYTINGWTTLEGDDGRQVHSGAIYGVVADAALRAIRDLSIGRSSKFEYNIEYKTKEADMKTAASRAKLWYRMNKAQLAT
jgi:HEAT repeat protein